ncbi:MAG TPA: hypothetical protein VLK27_03990 [Chthoniobacterales bacterium]|nr:hypothetical protein [Chthoniobacterales bacterium]
MKRISILVIALSIFCVHSAQPEESKPASLNDLKKLDITCFVPSYLPKGFKLKSANIITEENSVEGQTPEKVATYAIEWSGPNGATFSIESAWEGIGDRNIMETEDSEEAEFQSPLFGRVYIIYTPKGKGDTGVKKQILSNWVEDANMQTQPHGGPITHAGLGRFHGFTGEKMTVADFTKIVNSLHPVKGAVKTAAAPPLKLHPKIFNMIDCWISDSEAPIVTEINLDAVETNTNQFNMDDVKPDGEWTRVPTKEDGGFMRYRVLGLKGNRYTVEYQENGGGSLTTDSTIDFVIDKRAIERDGKTENIRTLRVVSYKSKQ